MNNDDSGLMACLGLRVLLEGAVAWLEQHSKELLCEADSSLSIVELHKRNAVHSALRSRVFRQGYWLSPFGDVSRLRVGVMRRVQYCKKGAQIPKEISRLIGFIQSDLRSLEASNLKSCMEAVVIILKPAIVACDSLLAGSIPVERKGA